MADLIDFDELENDENVCPFDDDDVENRAPKLAQSPVIVNPILKQSTRDNLIQLYTPVQKPVKGKLKVTFGSDTLLETPNVKKSDKGQSRLKEITPEKQKTQSTDEDEKEEWRDRTSVLTTIDHKDYSQYATEFLEEIIQKIPIKEDEDSSIDSGVDSTSAMDCSEYEAEPLQFPVPADTNNSNNSNSMPNSVDDIMAEAQKLLMSIQNVSEPEGTTKQPEDLFRVPKETISAADDVFHVPKETISAAESEEEFMDCEEYMEVDSGEMADPPQIKIFDTTGQQMESNENEVQHAVDQAASDAVTVEAGERTLPDQSVQELSPDVSTSKVAEAGDSTVAGIDNIQTAESAGNVTGGPVTVDAGDSIDKDMNNAVTDTSHESAVHTQADTQDKCADRSVQDQTDVKSDTDNQQTDSEQHKPADEAGDVPAEVSTDKPPTFNDIDDQPILPKKGVYNLDDLDFDSMDPFKPKSQIVNSPDKVSATTTTAAKQDKQGQVTPDTQTAETVSNIETTVPENTDNEEKKVDLDKVETEDSESTKSVDTVAVSNVVDLETSQNLSSVNTDNSQHETDKVANVNNDTDLLSIEDPFKPQNQMMNSPVVKSANKVAIEEIDDPFKPRTQIMNSPDVSVKTTASVSDRSRDSSPPGELDDPFKTRSQIMNSPVPGQPTPSLYVQNTDNTADTGKPDTDSQESSHIQDNIQQAEQCEEDTVKCEHNEQVQSALSTNINNTENDSSTLESCVINKPEQQKETLDQILDEIEDPFKPKNQMVNSPVVKTKSVEPNFDEIQDPFKPNKQMVNSPARADDKAEPTLDNTEDPFKPKNQMANSPADKHVKPEVNLDDIQDPFKPNNQMVNSPIRNTGEPELNIDNIDDPFKPTKQMVNSPSQKDVQPQQMDFDNIEDPFKPKKQMMNSPAGKDAKPEVNFDEIDDPFKPKTQMMNSPITKGSDSSGPNLEDIEDPFKPKKQMQNSPVVKKNVTNNIDNVEDPFKPKKQMMNSPITKENDSSAPSLEDIEDPFKPKKQMQNSPVMKKNDTDNIDNIEDPFKPKNQMQNSPVGKRNDTAGIDNIEDPFKPRNQMQNSPVVKTNKEDGTAVKMVTDSEELNSTLTDTATDTATTPKGEGKAKVSLVQDNIVEESLEDVIEITSVTRRGEQPRNAKIANFDDLDIDENQFVSAAEVFNDPGMLDLLEQFGDPATKQQESALSRMSLYVKFDPLVEEAPNPRRFSVRPDQIEKIREYGLDDCLLLLGTPPKMKKRKSLSVNNMNNSLCSQLFVDKERGVSPLTQEAGEVDKILACSPTNSKESTPPVFKMPTLMGDSTESEPGLFEELKYTDTDMKKIRHSLQMEVQGLQLKHEQEKHKMKTESDTENQKLKQIIVDKDKQLLELEELRGICAMFEMTCMELKEKHKKDLDKKDGEIKTIQDERDAALNDIQSVEKAFTDLHKRYDKSKSIFEAMKKNEDALKKYATECHDNLKEKEKQITTMKKEHEEKSKSQHQEIDSLKKQIDESQNKLEAQVKLLQMKHDSMEKQLQQKVAENKELTDICDKLLASKS